MNTVALRNIQVAPEVIEAIEHAGGQASDEEHFKTVIGFEDTVGPSAPPMPPHGSAALHGN